LTGYDLASHHRPNVNLSSRTRALKRPKHDQPVDPAEDDASYANPGPLPFHKAFTTSDGSSLKLFVELRAPGYDGSTYTHQYDAANDRLTGVFDQVVARQTLDVVFIRGKS
jgi:hypothetical protein